jgi:hypothetical protein
MLVPGLSWEVSPEIGLRRLKFSRLALEFAVRASYRVIGSWRLYTRALVRLTRSTGVPFNIEKVNIDDLQAGELKTSWGLVAVHQAVPEDQAQALLKTVCIGTLLSAAKGAWDSSDEFNQLFPDYSFTSIEAFLSKVWSDKP